jgi:hypothetical protein
MFDGSQDCQPFFRVDPVKVAIAFFRAYQLLGVGVRITGLHATHSNPTNPTNPTNPMKALSKKIALLSAGLLCVTSLLAEPASPKIDLTRKVLSVDEVTVQAAAGEPARLTIHAAGMVNSGGWSKPMLRAGKDAVKNGVLVFEFVATPPSGPATMALAPVKASITVDKPAGYTGVEIVAQHHKKVAK